MYEKKIINPIQLYKLLNSRFPSKKVLRGESYFYRKGRTFGALKNCTRGFRTCLKRK